MENNIKTFEGGLNADSFKQNENQNEYSYAENIRLLGENAQTITLENVKGTKLYAAVQYCEKQNDPYNPDPNPQYLSKTMFINGEFYNAIGYCTVKDIAIILITNGTTGDILIHKPSQTKEDTHAFYSVIPKFSHTFISQNAFALALGYDREYHDTYAEIRSDGKLYYYIAGRNNKKSRAIVLTDHCTACPKSPVNDDTETLAFDYYLDTVYNEQNFDNLTTIIPYAKNPIIHLKGYDDPINYFLAGVENAGDLEAGTWKYTVRYIDTFGNKTNWSPISQEVPIYSEALTFDRHTNWNRVYGTASLFKCPKTVVLEVQNIDNNFAEIELAGVLNQDGIETAYIIKSQPLYSNASSIIFKHTGNETYLPIDIAEITIRKVNIFNFETLKSIDNYLFIAGIKETLLKNYVPLQEIADKITLAWKTYFIPESEGTFSSFAGDVNFPDARPKIGNYKIPYNCYYKLGYFRDEDYSFGIQFKLKDGSYTPVFPIGKADLNTSIPNLEFNADLATGLSCSTVGTQYMLQNVISQPLVHQDVPATEYDINVSLCSVDKNFSYYKEGAYIYRSPAHIQGYEIIDGTPRLSSDVNADLTTNYPYMNTLENKYVVTNMGKPRYVRVLHPEFNNIEIPNDANIEGYYILRADSRKYGRVKSTGASCIATSDDAIRNYASNDNDKYVIVPPTPTFLNYRTGYNIQYTNNFYIDGIHSGAYVPVFGFWSFDEIYAKQEYTAVPSQDVLEFIYVNLPMHSPNGSGGCGYPEVNSSGYPVTEINFATFGGCLSASDIAPAEYPFIFEWLRRLYLLLWTHSLSTGDIPRGNYINSDDATTLYAEVNMWERIQTKAWGNTHKKICHVVNYASNPNTYEFSTKACSPDWTTFFIPASSDGRIRVDLITSSPVYYDDDNSCNYKTRLMVSHPCKLILVNDYVGLLYGIETAFNSTPDQNRIRLSGRGLVYYAQIRRREHQFPAPIYREYVYASLFQPATNNTEVNTYDLYGDFGSVVGVKHYNLNVFGGDCYIGKYFLQMQRRDVSPIGESLSNTGDGIPERLRYRTIYLSMYAESINNISLINVMKKEDGAVLQFGHFPYFNRGDIDRNRENEEMFSDEGTEYNLGYTTNKSTFAQVVKDFTNEENITKYQIRYSLKQLDIIKEDQYRIFLANNFADAVRRFGKIVKLENLNEALIIGQEDGIGMYRVSQAAQVPSTAGEIQLAVSGVLSDKPEYYAKENEIGVQDLFGIFNEGGQLFVFDKRRRQIATVGQGADIISKSKNINSIIKSLVYETKQEKLPVFISKNRYHNEIYFKIRHHENSEYKSIDVPYYTTPIPDMLMYDMKLQKFVSFMTYTSDIDYSVNDRYFGIGKDAETNNLVLAEYNLGQRGRFYNKLYNAKIKHNVTAKTNSTFDSIKIFGNSDYLDKQYRVFKDRVEVFPYKALFRTSYQYGYKEFINNYNIRDILFSQRNNVPIDNILYKEQLWHTDFPFAIPIDNQEWIVVQQEKNLINEFFSTERLRDFYCEVLWELNNGADYPEDSKEYLMFADKRYRWLYIMYLTNPSTI